MDVFHKILLLEVKWAHLEDIVLNKRNRAQKEILHDFPHMWKVKKRPYSSRRMKNTRGWKGWGWDTGMKTNKSKIMDR